MKKIAVGDLGEFWYGDYKEPFEQLEGGVPGYPVGVLLKDDDGAILCAYCGKTFASLGVHVSKTHGMSPAEYKRETGLLQKSSLASEGHRLASKARALRRGSRYLVDLLPVAREARKASYGPNKSMRTPEVLNRTGRCYSQLLAVGITLLREQGRISATSLRKRGINETAVLAFWDSMNDFRSACGDLYQSPRRGWSDTQLTAALRVLGSKLGRTPTLSDLRRYGLPSEGTFRKHFGTYSEACVRAGLDPNLPVTPDANDEVEAFVAYASIGDIRRAAEVTRISEKRIVAMFTKYGAPFFAQTANGRDSTARREWAADMARRLAGVSEQAVA